MWSEVHGFEPLVPRRERNESLRGTRTVKDATKVRLEAVAYPPGTDGSNPIPSSAESGTNRRRRVRSRRTQNGSAARSFAQAVVRHPQGEGRAVKDADALPVVITSASALMVVPGVT